METVTYIVNTYNRKEKLFVALDSIFKQVGVKIKVIVVDDYSESDLTSEMTERYGESVYLIRNCENYGLAKSRQIGLEAADTKFIAFLDDDDYIIDERKTQRHVEYLKNHPNCALVCTNVRFFSTSIEQDSNISFPRLLFNHLLKRNGVIYPSTTTVRKSFMIESGGFDSQFPRGIDSDVYRRILKNRRDITFDSTVTTNYLVEADDKITDHVSMRGIKKDIISNTLVITKYWRDLIAQPRALGFRCYVILRGTIKIIYIGLTSRW